MFPKLTSIARPLLLGAALALFVDLFFDWFRASVQAPGVSVESGASGLSGWGIVTGALVVALVMWETRGAESVRKAYFSMLVSVAVLATSVGQFATGEAHVEAGAVASVSSDRRWPAYVGIALACAVVAGAVTRLGTLAATRGPSSRTPAHGSSA
jgi:hypothetical protein